MKFPVLWSGLCCYTEGWGGKCSEILATIKLLYNRRVNKGFTSLYFTRQHSHTDLCRVMFNLSCQPHSLTKTCGKAFFFGRTPALIEGYTDDKVWRLFHDFVAAKEALLWMAILKTFQCARCLHFSS